MGWAKVPTGTTATSCFKMLVALPTAEFQHLTQLIQNYSAIFNTTVNFVGASNYSIYHQQFYCNRSRHCIFKYSCCCSYFCLHKQLPPLAPEGVTYNFGPTNNNGAMGYNITSTTDSRTWTYFGNGNSGFKSQPALAVMSVFFSAN